MAGLKKLHAVIVASHKKTIINPNKEVGGAIPIHSLATTAGQGKGNSISSPPTPEQTLETPRPCRKTIAPGEPTLSRSADLRGNQASSSPATPQVALPRRELSSGSLILTWRRLHHLDDVPRKPTRIQAEPLPGAAGEGPPPSPRPRGFARWRHRQRRREGGWVVLWRLGLGAGGES
jgi:hypothetical protein